MEAHHHKETRHRNLPGRRAFSVEMIAADRAVEEKRAQLGSPDRPQLIKAQKLASKALGLEDANYQVLKALCCCTSVPSAARSLRVLAWSVTSVLAANGCGVDRGRAIQRRWRPHD